MPLGVACKLCFLYGLLHCKTCSQVDKLDLLIRIISEINDIQKSVYESLFAAVDTISIITLSADSRAFTAWKGDVSEIIRSSFSEHQ